MKHYTITKTNFLKWYYQTGDDQSQIDQATKLGFSVIYALMEKGECTYTALDIWGECNHDCIPLNILEEFEDNKEGELSDLEDGWKVTLIS